MGHLSPEGPSPAGPGLISDAHRALCAPGWGRLGEGTDEGQSAGRRSAGREPGNFSLGYRLIAKQFDGNKIPGGGEEEQDWGLPFMGDADACPNPKAGRKA